jgi:molybdopterin synthase catalytic subunit
VGNGLVKAKGRRRSCLSAAVEWWIKEAVAYAALKRSPIDVSELAARVKSGECGGYVTFVGDVRNHATGKTVVALSYDAYEPLALRELERLAKEAEEGYSAICAVEHRLGPIPIGETAVAIVVGCAHRSEAFEACKWLIDTVKATVPIWKHETYEDGSVWIEGGQSVPTTGN